MPTRFRVPTRWVLCAVLHEPGRHADRATDVPVGVGRTAGAGGDVGGAEEYPILRRAGLKPGEPTVCSAPSRLASSCKKTLREKAWGANGGGTGAVVLSLSPSWAQPGSP